VAGNFLPCDRDQELLLPPSLREWLPEDHLAWFVLDAVDELDLSAFYGAYREDGWGRAAFDPQMMVGFVAVRVCGRGALEPRDRAALPRGRRLPGADWQPDPRSCDDRSLSRPPRAGAVRHLHAGAGALRAGGAGIGGSGGARRQLACRQCFAGRDPQLRLDQGRGRADTRPSSTGGRRRGRAAGRCARRRARSCPPGCAGGVEPHGSV